MNQTDLPQVPPRSTGSNEDLHGNAPDKSGVALLLIDLINDLEFEGGDQLLENTRLIAKNILALKKKASEASIPIIYANDNFGRWRSNFHAQIEHCLKDFVRGREIVELLRPDEDDYFVLKPKHSAFHSTSLSILLEHLGVHTLILTGIASNICVLFTATDAYMQDFGLLVPKDCVAANSTEDNEYALKQMKAILKADLRPSTELKFEQGEVAF